MDVALDVLRRRVLTPPPCRKRRGIEFELTAWRRPSAQDLAVDLHADGTASVRIVVGAREWNDILRRRLVSARLHASIFRDRDVVKLALRYQNLVQRPDVARNFKGSVLPHECKRCQTLGRGTVRKPRNRIFKNKAIILIELQLLARILLGFEILTDSKLAVGIDSP